MTASDTVTGRRALTAAQVFTARQASVKAKITPPNNNTYTRLRRDVLHPVIGPDAQNEKRTHVHLRLDDANIFTDAYLPLYLPAGMLGQTTDYDENFTRPVDWARTADRQIFTAEHLWTQWPRLWVHAPTKQDLVHKHIPLHGWIEADDKPKGGGIRIKRPHQDPYIYETLNTLVAGGWVVDRAANKMRK